MKHLLLILVVFVMLWAQTTSAVYLSHHWSVISWSSDGRSALVQDVASLMQGSDKQTKKKLLILSVQPPQWQTFVIDADPDKAVLKKLHEELMRLGFSGIDVQVADESRVTRWLSRVLKWEKRADITISTPPPPAIRLPETPNPVLVIDVPSGKWHLGKIDQNHKEDLQAFLSPTSQMVVVTHKIEYGNNLLGAWILSMDQAGKPTRADKIVSHD